MQPIQAGTLKPLATTLGALVCVVTLAHADPPAPASGAVRVDVSTFKNHDGALGCRLFSVPANFPDGAGVNQKVTIVASSARCAFDNVAPGTYAVAVIHDENGNGKLDKSFFGVPTEGYGVSNNHTYSMSSPKWDESKFTIAAGETKTLAITLRY
jgi:uncharacterized protein (DUF2141 family)